MANNLTQEQWAILEPLARAIAEAQQLVNMLNTNKIPRDPQKWIEAEITMSKARAELMIAARKFNRALEKILDEASELRNV